MAPASLETVTSRYEIRDAELLSNAERAVLGSFIVSGFPGCRENFGDYLVERWSARAWRTTPAVAHAIASDADGQPVGQLSVFRLSVVSNRVVFGFGDMIVAEAWRGQGMARALIQAAFEETCRRGAQAVCARTHGLGGPLAALGFREDEQGRWFSDESGQGLPALWVWLADGCERGTEPLNPSDF